ncbi:DNA-directed RNA polymerase subunit E'' [Candidatus Micrarchaeota archaeon]|nr:DNA-directed RNA polymerase subunit E'' [Candidatus Micrarchaeota archaeon]
MHACRNCRMLLTEEKVCPKCQGTDFTDKFSGEIIILSPEKSEIAQFTEINAPGKFAIKVK